MAGEKIEAAKEALRQYVNILGNDDDLTLVAFGIGSGVETLLLRKRMDSSGKAEVSRKVESLSAQGGTPLYGAVQQFTVLARGSAQSPSLVLLTDGQAGDNSDPAAYAELLKGTAESISRSYVMGVGADYDETLLTAIKNATNGQFENIISPSDVVSKFQEISRKSRRVVVQSPKMLVRLTRGVALSGIYRVEPQIQELTDQVKPISESESEVFMPDLVADEDQQYVMMLTIPARSEGEYREGKIRFQGIDNPPHDLVVGRSSLPNMLLESDSAPRLLFVQTKERWVAQKALGGDKSAIAETQKILATYQNNPDKMKTMPLSHRQDLEKVTQLVSAGGSADSQTKKQVTARLTKRIEK